MSSLTESTIERMSQESQSSVSSGQSMSQASSSSSSTMEPSQPVPDPVVRPLSDSSHPLGRGLLDQPHPAMRVLPDQPHPVMRVLTDQQHPVTRAAKMIPPAIPGLPLLKSSQSLTQQRRSSTRSIKRKKFDDELVESSLIKIDRGRVKPFGIGGIATAGTQTDQKLTERGENLMPMMSEAILPPPPPTDTVSVTTTLPTTSTAPVSSGGKNFSTPAPPAPPEKKKVTPAPAERRKSSKSSSKRARRPKVKPTAAASLKDLGRWKPQDDLMLIGAVQQTNDLSVVHMGVKFSCKFTLKEIQERWYALLYDPAISKVAISAIKQLHPDLSAAAQGKTLCSQGEEELIGTLAHNSQPTLDAFQDLLDKHPHVFHPSRTAKALHNHWLLMKQYHLLPDQSVQPMPKGDHILHFSDAEDLVEDEQLREPKNEVIDQELSVADRRQKREIRQLEQELPKWQVLVDHVTGISPPDFDSQTLAVLRGRLVRYLMRSREITLGRTTKDNQIDVDLSLEGPAWKISRKQGAIKLRNNGEFFIANEGKRPIYVDGMPVLGGSKQKLNNNSVVEISCLRFIFLVNQDLISVIQNDTSKTTT